VRVGRDKEGSDPGVTHSGNAFGVA
jgi:hypothetical protein